MLGDVLAASPHRPRRPSPYLISFLATISAATPSDALPVDCSYVPFLPVFLCPRLSKRSQQDLALTHPSFDRSASSSSSGPQHTNTLDSRDVPDHYVKGADGLWYQLPYATTIPCPSPTDSSIQVEEDDTDDIADVTSGPVTASPSTSSSSSSATISFKLPPGWQQKAASSDVYRVPLIVVSAIILASLIVILIVGMVLWRRKVTRHAKGVSSADLEKRSHWLRKRWRKTRRKVEEKHIGSDSGSDDEIEDPDRRSGVRVRSQTSSRVRSSARWRTHVKGMYRRSRGRRVLTGSSTNLPTVMEPPTINGHENAESNQFDVDSALTGLPSSVEQTVSDNGEHVNLDLQPANETTDTSGSSATLEANARSTGLQSSSLQRGDLSRRHRSLSSSRSVHTVVENHTIVQEGADDESGTDDELLHGLPPSYQRARSAPPSRRRFISMFSGPRTEQPDDNTGPSTYADEKARATPVDSGDVEEDDDHDSEGPDFNSHSGQLDSVEAQVAHVATDDKRLLARIADLASAPPVLPQSPENIREDEPHPPYTASSSAAGPVNDELSSGTQQRTQVLASVPDWPVDDELEIEMFAASSSTSSPSRSAARDHSNRTSSDAWYLPPPPRQNVLHLSLETETDDIFPPYPFAPNYIPQDLDFDEDSTLNVISEPSAPPLEDDIGLFVQNTEVNNISEDRSLRVAQAPSAPLITEFDLDEDFDTHNPQDNTND